VKERISDGRLFQTEGHTIEKALCCLMAIRLHHDRNIHVQHSQGKVYFSPKMIELMQAH